MSNTKSLKTHLLREVLINPRRFSTLKENYRVILNIHSKLRDPGGVGPEGARISEITISPWYCPSKYTCYRSKFS